MSIQDELIDTCAIKRWDFDEIFNEFFDQHPITIDSAIFPSDCDKSAFYGKLEIIKLTSRFDSEELLVSAILKKWLIAYTGYHIGMTIGDPLSNAKQKLNNYNFDEHLPLSGLCLDWVEEYEIDDVMYNGKKSDKRQSVSHLEILAHLHWDLGELILFILTEGFLQSPSLYSKIKTKWEEDGKVKGSDGVHIFHNWENFGLYFWESKITKWITDAWVQAKKSIETFIANKDLEAFERDSSIPVRRWLWKEIRVIWDQFNSVQLKYPLLAERICKFINPYRDNFDTQNNDLPYEIVVFYWYRCENYKKFLGASTVEADYRKYVSGLCEKLFRDFSSVAVNSKKVKLFLLPLTDEVELIKQFLLQTKV
ncbi:MAG: hypothetical protein ACD_71C00007G0006 [uncultured bacterium (gcode 4)]|uniref:Anti-bacteriophage protein A/HamA C-terminal domain-containing protein n=1 Tax=uncultured bacterium (gcode 4) TaxID=1234023 RepID=K2A3W6_9BACT|nr:MAG: hypothetical protein ACD_71C00007G0006 [uncultured bacterium (gcode 4)]